MGCLLNCLACCTGVSLRRLLFLSLRGSSLSWFFRACTCACVCASVSCTSALPAWPRGVFTVFEISFWIFQSRGRLFQCEFAATSARVLSPISSGRVAACSCTRCFSSSSCFLWLSVRCPCATLEPSDWSSRRVCVRAALQDDL